ncbi:hypothetical protein BDF19DRAFT_79358 [Syncephalis fuscata]|nr:hypothetical protein BDF19DRAFT_79358 [Syncephalis fuscata]
MPPSPPALMSPLMSPHIGSPTLLPTILSPTLSACQDGSPSFQGLAQFEAHLGISPNVSVDVSDINAHDSTLLLNSPPSVPDMYATLDANLLLGMPADAFLTHELLSGINTSISMDQFQQQQQQQQHHHHYQHQQLQQQSPLQYTGQYPFNPSDVHDFWQDPNDVLNSKAMLGAAMADNTEPELPLLFGMTDQSLDSSTWQVASLTAAHI